MVIVSLALAAALALAGRVPSQTRSAKTDPSVERQHVLTITAQQIDGGVLSEITWDNGTLLLQGAVANPDGSLSGRYVVVPAVGTTLAQLTEQTAASMDYWTRKSKRTSPTGLGTITSHQDSKMPMYGVGGLDQRIGNAVDMGGIQHKVVLRLGKLVIHERDHDVEPYDGEVWSWSPAELNRIAYVDGGGDLWVASADGRDAARLLKGHFTLPAWSEDGKSVAVAERQENGRRWDISVVRLPPELRSPR
jgi:hypothetical protein